MQKRFGVRKKRSARSAKLNTFCTRFQGFEDERRASFLSFFAS